MMVLCVFLSCHQPPWFSLCVTFQPHKATLTSFPGNPSRPGGPAVPGSPCKQKAAVRKEVALAPGTPERPSAPPTRKHPLEYDSLCCRALAPSWGLPAPKATCESLCE